ncbi:hypothetical protein [Blastococcus brunescens]|uniref:Uncharacterized protein n=1 Tax=Blastococcus brunescens TaxID=1564165 RepID=A0ABZ1B453_9ACTN|nr:hypothetical protein [Blastococcus sp. BMG 8361]WRL64598.1 hypothetical protein U6N30_02005 [Blastococcus sp. BMG 8361]
MSYAVGRAEEAEAAADEALAAADALGLDGAWSDIAVTQLRARPGLTPGGYGPASTRHWCERAGPVTSTWRCGCCSTTPRSPSRPAGSTRR